MPIERQPTNPQDVNLENEPFVFSPEQFRDLAALQLVVQSFGVAEPFRNTNHDPRWMDAENLYLGYVPSKVWDGTNIPRANLPVQIAFDQVESAYPKIMQALFPDDEWFEVLAEPGGNPMEAREVENTLRYTLSYATNDYGLSAEAEVGMAVRDILKYGNGGVWLDWDSIHKRPTVSWVDLRDVYIDPATPTSNIDEARFIIRRRMLTVEQIEEFRGDNRMKVPEHGILYSMCNNAPGVSADTTRQMQEQLRNVQYSPQQADWIPNPADRKIEVLMYYSKNQIIWILNRVHVLFNGGNPYGYIPACLAPCFPIPGRFYALGVPEVLRGIQRMAEGLLNGHLDEVSLGLHPPRTVGRSGSMTNNQRRWGPGAVFTVDPDKNDFSLQQPKPVTQNVIGDVQFILAQADRRTGIGEFAQSGMPRPGNANRTATGMSLQNAGVESRLQPIVRNIENFLLIPLLRKLVKMIGFHTGVYDKIPGMKTGEFVWSNGWSFQKPMQFRTFGASKMLAKANLMQVFPFVTQYLLSGPFIQSLQSTGQTVDFAELIRMLQDAAGTNGRYQLIRPMNQQEQQAAQQPPPEMMAQMQQQQAKADSAKEIMAMKIQGELQKTAMTQQGSPEEAQMRMVENQQKMQLEREKAELQMALQRQKLEHEAQISQMKLQMEQQQNQIKLASAASKMQMDQQKASLDLEMQEQQSQNNLMTAMATSQQQFRQSEESHKQGLRQQSEMAKMKTSAAEKGPSAGAQPRKKAQVRSKKK